VDKELNYQSHTRDERLFTKWKPNKEKHSGAYSSSLNSLWRSCDTS